MKRILGRSAWAGLLLCAAKIMTAQAQNTFVAFSVDMSSNLVAGTFNPAVPAYIGGILRGGTGMDTVYARGIFDGWAIPGLQLIQAGNSGVFTNTVDDNAAQDQSDGNMNWTYAAYLNGTFTGEPQSDYANRMAYLPKGNNATLVLPTAYFGDGGPATTNEITFQVDMTEEIQFGSFHPNSGDYVVVAGSYNGFSINPATARPFLLALTNNPSFLVTNNSFALVESNVWMGSAAISTDLENPVATVNCMQEFEYVILPKGDWDSPLYPNVDPDDGHRFYTMSGNQTLPLVNFGDLFMPPLATVNLSVDMSVIAKYDLNFEPNSVTVWGAFNGWSAPVAMTNNVDAANTNLYTTGFLMSEGVPYVVQFRYTNFYIGSWVFDYGQDGGPNPANNDNNRHVIFVPITSGPLTTNFSFFFNDISTNDVLTIPTAVQFTVDMTGAVGTDGHAFVPGNDDLYINGMFVFPPSEPVAGVDPAGVQQDWYAWSGGVPVLEPVGFRMMQVGSSEIYTNIVMVPAGTPVGLSYQYGIDIDAASGGPAEDEAPAGANHFRVVRSQQFNPYVMATDTFTSTPYEEPFFSDGNICGYGSPAGGNLTVGTPVAGKVPVSWLGRPGAQLQSTTILTGPWTNNPLTDGYNWTAGFGSTNGFVSVTNWPASGNTFFRVVKP